MRPSELEDLEDYCENDMDADTMVKLLGNERIQELIVGFVPERHWLPALVESLIEEAEEGRADAILDAERVENDRYF
jgi:hypothetical protein